MTSRAQKGLRGSDSVPARHRLWNGSTFIVQEFSCRAAPDKPFDPTELNRPPFWVDPMEDVRVDFMTQLMPSSAYPIRRELQTVVNAAIVDRA